MVMLTKTGNINKDIDILPIYGRVEYEAGNS